MEEKLIMEKLTTREIVSAGLSKNKANKIKAKFIGPSEEETPAKILYASTRKKVRANQQKIVKEILKKFPTVRSFLEDYYSMECGLFCVEEVMRGYLKNDRNNFVKYRLDVWNVLTFTDKNMHWNPKYYTSIAKCFGSTFKDILGVILLDVKRTRAAISDPNIFLKLSNVLHSFAKRNSKIGYCQGLNSLVCYFLEKGLSEEECFWYLVHIIENLMPQEYYTNMLSLTSDIKIVLDLLNVMHPRLASHLERLNMDLSNLIVESFVTIYTSTVREELCDVILDYFFIEGSLTLIKAQVLIFGYMKEKLITVGSFGRDGSNPRRVHYDLQRRAEEP